MTETVFLIGGYNFDKLYEQDTDALLFCHEDNYFVREIEVSHQSTITFIIIFRGNPIFQSTIDRINSYFEKGL